MAITAADELLVRGRLTEMLEAATSLRVIPAPTHFDGPEDFLATWESLTNVNKDTQAEVEAVDIIAIWLWLIGWVDNTEDPPDSPEVTLQYDVLLFAQYDHERADETVSPDAFAKRQLKRHNNFVAAALGAKAAFQGQRSIGVLSTSDYAYQYSDPLSVVEPLLPSAQCEFVPGIRGHRMKLREEVKLKLIPC